MKRLFLAFFVFLMFLFSCSMGNKEESPLLGEEEQELIADEQLLLSLKRKASIVTESITDEFIKSGKIIVESIVTEEPGNDGISAKGYIGVEFRDDDARSEYIARVKPLVTDACGEAFSNVIFSDEHVSTQRSEPKHNEWKIVNIHTLSSSNAGDIAVIINLRFSGTLFWNWHNWRIDYEDKKSPKAYRGVFELFATGEPTSKYITHLLSANSTAPYGDGGTYKYEISDPSLNSLYSEGVYDDYKKHSWWVQSSKYEARVTLYGNNYTNSEIVSATRL